VASNILISDYLVSPCVEESSIFGPVPDLTCPMPLLADPAWPFPGVELEPACPMVEPAPEEVEPTADGVEPAPDGPVWACELDMPEIIEMASVVAASSVEIRIGFFSLKVGRQQWRQLRQLRCAGNGACNAKKN
jgi:hypothetical protein